MIVVICCECGKHLGYKDGGEGISHSYCNECMNKQMEEIKRFKLRK